LPSADSQALQFLGDTGNVAAKLEAETKRLGCTLAVWVAALALVAPHTESVVTANVSVPGKDPPMAVALLSLSRPPRLSQQEIVSPFRFSPPYRSAPTRGARVAANSRYDVSGCSFMQRRDSP
jgi:hypothetical protein